MENLIFVSAQPDLPYFHWQIKLYIHNFVKHGINPKNIHVILGILQGQIEPSDGAIEILKQGVNLHFYKDEREKKLYIPSIKPYLIHKWIEQDESRGKQFFLHDSDIILTKESNFKNLLNDDIIYLSDTKNYIGYDYLKSCSTKYEKNFPNCKTEQLIDDMCEVIGVDKELIIKNKENSGGAQYIIKNTDSNFWKKVYEDSTEMYHKMTIFQKRYPLKKGSVQTWTAEMWSLLWNLWKLGHETKISEELDFVWGTDNIQKFFEKPILHMAGVTEDMKYRKFFKGDFINKNPIQLLKEDINYFNFIEPKSITIKYVDNMKSFIQKPKIDYL